MQTQTPRRTPAPRKQARRKRTPAGGSTRLWMLALSVILVVVVMAMVTVQSMRLSDDPTGQTVQNTQSDTKQDTEPEEQSQQTQTSQESNQEPVSGENTGFVVEREPTSVTLMAVGDNLMHITCVNSGLQADGSYDYTEMYKYMLDDIQEADIACINQETPFVNDPSQYSNYPCFGGPTAIGDSLVEVGFDLVTHATNHIWDKGEVSFYDTLNFWKDNHPETTVLGIHETEADSQQIQTVTKNGITIAFLNYTYGLNGFVATEDWMVDLLIPENKEKIAADIAKAKECSDIVIVFPHWGTEYMFEPVQDQLDWAQFFADEGVDVAIGCHPHVLEPMDVVTGKDGNEMICYYSLGNYISHQSNYYQMLGGMANLTITKDDTGTYVSDYSLTPTMTWITQGYTGKEFHALKLEDYTDDMAALHTVPETGVDHMWELYYSIVGEEETGDSQDTQDLSA